MAFFSFQLLLTLLTPLPLTLLKSDNLAVLKQTYCRKNIHSYTILTVSKIGELQASQWNCRHFPGLGRRLTVLLSLYAFRMSSVAGAYASSVLDYCLALTLTDAIGLMVEIIVLQCSYSEPLSSAQKFFFVTLCFIKSSGCNVRYCLHIIFLLHANLPTP